MKKNFILLLALLGGCITAGAQAPQTVIVEHFTNTWCSICAARNPAFYQTLGNYPQVLHIAYHPSSPYTGCYFNQQNKPENDGRTNFYNVFGATPRVVVQGKVLASANPSITNSTLDTVLNKTSPVEVLVYETPAGNDSVTAKIVVRTTESTSLTTANLFAAVTESPIYYNAQNGETVHYDVFRKALTAVTGLQFLLPAPGDSIIFNLGYKVPGNWNVANLSTIAIVQRADNKEVLNAGKSSSGGNTTGITESETHAVGVYPNPAEDALTVTGLTQPVVAKVFDLNGRVLIEQALDNNHPAIHISALQAGLYILKAENIALKFLKQ